MKTKSFAKHEIDRSWFVVDADDQVLGRMASEIAKILRGKHKPTFTAHADTGDFVVVLNAEKVKLTGKKETDKRYRHHTGWVGGLRSVSAAELRAKHPEDLVKKAVWGMLPKGPLGREMFSKLKVYVGSEHPHTAQNPQELSF
ncbi:MAG: 50S ribosomal protein L13 [Deltaproteobacteria bacterium]|jgi:large subunit ribosomal protein L13|nr:50S ribosomal protein L13 [Deltaproteobacteria bacterium]MBT6432465.1 50S ribosomal protein L13 [Deltaproteobacteria bacterium]MBT6488583.1 50S ribosomal protein L13 [Deltaproteobacteria bacterium]